MTPKNARQAAGPQLADLDFLIMAKLPAEGTRLGYHTIGATVKGLTADLAEGGLTGDLINGRLKHLEFHGLVAGVVLVPTSQGKGYQITERGKELLERNRALLDSLAPSSGRSKA